MHGVARVAASSIEVEFDGQTLLIDPLTVADIGTIQEKIVRERRANKLATVADVYSQLPREAADAMLREARMEAEKLRIDSIEFGDVLAWMRTIGGMIYTFWLLLEKRYPGRFPHDRVAEVIRAADDHLALKESLGQAFGADELGNSPSASAKGAADAESSSGNSPSSPSSSGLPSPTNSASAA